MTNEEMIETIKSNYPPENYLMLREALDNCIALLNKQIPTKVRILQETKKSIEYVCPNCEGTYYHYKRARNWFPRYCHNCGQRIEER